MHHLQHIQIVKVSLGACLTSGHGSLLFLLSIQKINTKSSSETKLIGVDDAITFVMWLNNFFESQVGSINVNS